MGKAIWFTGLSGAGKTTIANNLKKRLELLNKKVKVLDGDHVREKFHKNLTFSRDDIRTNNRLVAEIVKENLDECDFILIPIISPYTEDRSMARKIIGKNFIELYINADIKKCLERDVKGLYKKAMSGEIKNFIGISESNPYQPPTNPDIEVVTSSETEEECVQKILNYLEK